MILSTPTHPRAWLAILTLTAVVGSLAAACLMPFTALAVLAAATLPGRQAVAAVVAAWAFNQAAGFAWLGYPHEAATVFQGAVIGAASLAALVTARALAADRGGPRVVAAFVAAFVAYELVLLLGALPTGGLWTFAPRYVAQIAMVEALWFLGLGALALVLQRLAPAVSPPRPLRLRPA
ncbi:MAG: hypothetical protein U1C74_20795 [Phenylobacterium sp.]|nr:hypothetical protein [Phenylobacterium sp.]